MNKIFLDTLAGKMPSRIPFWFMRQAGRYLPEYMALRSKAGSFLDLCYNPDFAIEVTLQPIRRFDMDAAILFSDILTVPQALGQKLSFTAGEGPKLDTQDLPHLKFNPEHFHTHLAPVYETVSGLSAALPADKALIGFAGSPWTVATYMIEGGGSKDFKTVKAFAYADFKGFQALIDMLIEATSAYLIKQAEHGADAVQLFDSWAGVLPEAGFHRWVIAPTRAIVKTIRKTYPDLPIIGFPRGAGLMYRDYVRETGVTAVSFDQTLPLSFVRDELQSVLPVQGGLDNGLLLAGGDAMLDAAKEMLDALSGKPYIFNLGHGVIKETPPEHVAQLSEFIKNYCHSGESRNPEAISI